MSSYKLIYFNVPVRGEPIRWIFAVAKQPYVDERIDFQDWFEHKTKLLFGQVPVLEHDGQRLYQSHAIMNYLARQFGLAGKTSFDQARALMVALTVEDALRIPVTRIVSESDAVARAELIQKYKNEQLPGWLGKFETLLSMNNEGNSYFVGDELTYADLAIVSFFDEVTIELGIKVILDDYPKLAALKTRVEANEGLAEWLSKRPPIGDTPTVELVAGYKARMAAKLAAQAQNTVN